MSSNALTIYDEDGDTPDWIELFNGHSEGINLDEYGLSDSLNSDFFWPLPEFILGSGQHLLIFASGKDRREAPLYWETLIDRGDSWKYILPTEALPDTWHDLDFDDSEWLEGKSSIGYGDNDDSTVVENTISVFLRKTFDISDPQTIKDAVLHVDYDDGFIAFINGVEIARSGFYSADVPSYNATTDALHEAVMFKGGRPQEFEISSLSEILLTGANTLTVQVHNGSETSSDLTIIPILSVGSTTPTEGKVSEYLELSPKSLHTHFKISSEGETLYLRNNLNEVIDTMATGALTADISIGRSPDGSNGLRYFDAPTPGDSNLTAAYQTFSNPVLFSEKGGLFDQSFYLSMTSDNPEDSIYYTLDGTDPVKASYLYSDSLLITTTSNIRARVLHYDGIPGRIQSQSYLFGIGHSLPVISITTDPKNFFDYHEGIYVRGPNANGDFPYFNANFWQDWERPVHIEMYKPNGKQVFSIAAGAKIFGGWSRGHDQKSLTIHARKSYGDGPINEQLFPDKELNRFSSIVLRNSGNDWNNSMMRDGLLTSLFHKVVDRQAFRPSVVYLNGAYWGIQNIREKVNEHFLADNHNLHSDSINLLERNGQAIYGNEEDYLEMLDFISSNLLSINGNYEYIKTQMDIFNFIQYQIGNIFVDNTDWPGNNIKFWKSGRADGRWRWIAFDTDFGFGIWDYNKVNNNTLDFALDANGPDWPNPPWSTFLFRQLISNTDFKNLFINAFADQLNTTLLSSNVKSRIDYHKNLIENEIENHMARWDGSLSHWNTKVGEMYDFANTRPRVVRDHIKSQFGIPSHYNLMLSVTAEAYGEININTITPDNYPWSGIYFSGIPITLKAIPKPGYSFVRWEGDLQSFDDSTSVNLSANATIRAIFEETNSELSSVIINEINYNPPSDFDVGDWVELYNKSNIDIDLSSWLFKDDDDAHTYVIPDGTVIRSNGFLVICRDQGKFTASFPNVTNYVGDLPYGLSSDGDCVRLFKNDDIPVDEVCYENGDPWPENPNGNGYTLALKNPLLDNADGENWYALERNGNPGEDNSRAITGIDASSLPIQLANYPNPFTSFTRIEYFVAQPGYLSLSVYDIRGKEVEKLYEGNKPRGKHSVEWNAGITCKPGIYLLKLTSRSGNQIRKMVIR